MTAAPILATTNVRPLNPQFPLIRETVFRHSKTTPANSNGYFNVEMGHPPEGKRLDFCSR